MPSDLLEMVEELKALPIPFATEPQIDGLPADKSAEYLSHFLPPRVDKQGDSILCVCGAKLWGGGLLGMAFMSTFTWGLVHGEGFCRTCKYPTRMYHKFDEGGFTFPLQYHPDELEKKDA